MKYPVEKIIWLDSTTKSGWVEIETVREDLAGLDCESVGFVLDEDDFFVYIATTVSGYGCLSPISIPLEVILEREVLVDADEVDDE